VKTKRLWTLIGSICLTLVLAALLLPACAPAAAPGEETAELEAEIADLEDELDAKDSEISGLESDIEDLEDEIAALKKPAKVWNWKPSCWASAGIHWRCLGNICDYITEASDGRIVAEPTQPGALCSVPEQIEFVSTGATPAMFLYLDYWEGKVPLYMLASNASHVLYKPWQVRQYLEYEDNGRVLELIREETDKYYPGIHIVTPVVVTREFCATTSTVPIYGIEDIPGIKYRTGATADAGAWESFGAATTWFPGTECYTSLATGVVDAISYACASDCLEMGWDEVTDYWIREPYTQDTMAYWFTVNETEWGELSDDLKAIVSTAVGAADTYAIYDGAKVNAEAWEIAEEHGIEVIDWSDEDIIAYQKAVLDATAEFSTDAPSQEALQILEDFLIKYEPAIAELAGL